MTFDQRDARAIAKKLNATFEKGAKHDIAVIRYDGKIVGQFGIRRGSGSLGHNHIPGQIHVNSQQARLLVQCPMSFEDWVVVMKEKNQIEDTTAAVPVSSVRASSRA